MLSFREKERTFHLANSCGDPAFRIEFRPFVKGIILFGGGGDFLKSLNIVFFLG